MRIVLVLAAIAGLTVPALAQQRLPRVSPSEQQVRDLNQNLQRENRSLNSQQQNQFEVNQLRQELHRQQVFPPIVAPGPGRICAPGQIGC